MKKLAFLISGGLLIVGFYLLLEIKPQEDKPSPTEEIKLDVLKEETPPVKINNTANIEKANRIEEAIAKFHENMANISKSDLEEEQKRIQEILYQAKNLKISEPKIEDYIDENGRKWMKKIYEDGEIRFDFPQGE